MNDREKMFELLKTAPFDPIKGAIRKMGSQVPLGVIGNIADHLLANGVTFAKDTNVTTKWIPVTERLPEMPGKYLVTGRSFRDRIPQVWICECISFGSVIGWSNHALNPIVEAWMPLPQPPKEEAE